MNKVVYILIGIGIGVALTVLLMRDHNASAPGSFQPDSEYDNTDNAAAAMNREPGKPVGKKPAVISAEDPAEIESDTTAPAGERNEAAFQELMNKVWTGAATPEEQLEFWQSIRESDEIDKYIKAKEDTTPLDSDDIDAQMNLANLYVAKIYSSPAGPEQGLWAAKAEQRWRAVLAVDPNHWEAQHSVAFSLSQYPDFLNMTGAAIAEYEKVVAIQENNDPQPQYANTYLELYRLYEKKGDRGNAVDVIKQGLEQFPDDPALLEQWNSISTLVISE